MREKIRRGSRDESVGHTFLSDESLGNAGIAGLIDFNPHLA